MNAYDFTVCGAALRALGSGALWWPAADLLCVADLHLAKSERLARRGGALLPPYETRATLDRLEADMAATGPGRVVCLGDSFDDEAAAAALPDTETNRLARLMAGRDWIWVAGNHDPSPPRLGGRCAATVCEGALTFRHVAAADARGEISGHYHPKLRLEVRGRRLSRPCFLIDAARAILPAYGAYTGGLDCDAAPLAPLLGPDGRAVPIGTAPRPFPVPRHGRRPAGRAGAAR